MDTELAIHLVAMSSQRDFVQAFIEALRRFQGAYSMLCLHKEMLIAVRDPRGFRPLALGRLGDSWVVASETCAFDIISAEFVREIEPGEVLVIDKDGLHSHRPFTRMQPKLCIFEYVYVSRPDSIINGYSVYNKRLEMGRQLAREHPVEADMVIPVPDSANPAAVGYAQESGLPYQNGLIRSHYIGRTFIEPDQRIRDFGAKIKYNAVRPLLEGKRVIAVDDSIVRGTTSKKIVRLLREQGGAAEVHLRVSSPPWKNPCYYGIDTPRAEELIGSRQSVEEIRQYTGADSLGYISLEGLSGIFDQPNNHCRACFDGHYPGGRPGKLHKEILENQHSC
jgi:amidophosphoribosyltransferase